MCLDCFGHDNDTEYTAGFRAGSAFERDRIIKELEANEHIWRERVVLVALKALIKGETKPFITAAQVEQMADELLEE
jgi:hypothetical protein